MADYTEMGFPSDEDLKKNKCFFYSKKTTNLLIEVERNEVAYTYWTFTPNSDDEKVFNDAGVLGSRIITHEEGDQMLIALKMNTNFTFEDNITI